MNRTQGQTKLRAYAFLGELNTTCRIAFNLKVMLLAIGFACLTGNIAVAQAFFVSPKGSDLNDGSQSRPVKTLGRVLECILELRTSAAKEIVVNIASGTYLLNAPLVFSEKFSEVRIPIVFRGDVLSKPAISGGYRVGGFEKLSDTLWRAVIPEVQKGGTPFQQLYVNGQRAVRARTPNKGFLHPKSVSETIISGSNEKLATEAMQSVKLSGNDFSLLKHIPESDRSGAILKFYHNWDNTIRPISELADQDSSAVIRGKGMYSKNRIKKESLMVFENAISFLDEPGEWFLARNGELYYYPRKGEVPEKAVCFAPAIDNILVIKGVANQRVRNISFENLRIEVSGYRLENNTFEPSQAAAKVGATVEIDFAENISFKNCEFSKMGANAIWFRKDCSNGSVSNSVFRDLGAGAIKIGEPIQIGADSSTLTHHIEVDNNIISGGGRTLPCAAALIIFNSGDNVVSHNDISDFFYTAVSVGWTWGYAKNYAKRNKIVFNKIYNIGQGLLSDMGGIYTLGASEGTVIANNIIHHVVGSEYGGWGLYCDEGSSNILLENNLVYSCGHSAFHQHFGRDNIIRNNIFASNGAGELQLSRIEPNVSLVFTNNVVYSRTGKFFVSNWLKSNIKSDMNCYWSSESGDALSENADFKLWEKSGHDLHSIFANPFAGKSTSTWSSISEVVANKIGFKHIDFQKTGLYGQQKQRLTLGEGRVK